MELVSVSQAARILGIREQGVRERMKAGVYDIGVVWKPDGSKIYQYDIFRPKLEKLIGRELRDEELV